MFNEYEKKLNKIMSDIPFIHTGGVFISRNWVPPPPTFIQEYGSELAVSRYTPFLGR